MSLLHWRELDRGPNSIVSASKISSARQLQGYKEVANDPEFQALAQLKNQKVANDDLLQVYQMADEYKLIAMRLAYFIHGKASSAMSSGTASANASAPTIQRTPKIKEPGSGQKSIDSHFKQQRYSSPTATRLQPAVDAIPVATVEEAEPIQMKRGRNPNMLPTAFDESEMRSKTPIIVQEGEKPRRGRPPGSAKKPRATHEPVEPTEADTMEPSNSLMSFGSGRFYGGARDVEDVDNQNLFYKLIELCRKMNLILTSKIRNKIQILTQADIDKLTAIFNMIQNSQSDILATRQNTMDAYTYAVRRANNQSQHTMAEMRISQLLGIPMESLHLWDTERNALLITLTGIISAWRAITPVQAPIDPKTQNRFMTVASRSMQGAGRGMHGDMPNSMYLSDFMKSTNPHPLWYQNCPRKFLL